MTEFHSLYYNCRLCPFGCGVDRRISAGRCGETDKVRVALAYPHLWEEPCLSGQGIEEPVNGSGTVFFTGCNLGCIYCQNSKISKRNTDIGRFVNANELASIFLELQEKGVHNINLVTATHFAPTVIEALIIAKGNGLEIPIVYNTSGYETVEAVRMLSSYIDIFMPDFKYASSVPAKQYSFCPDYHEICRAAIKEMQKQKRKPVFDENGFLKSGVIVRHLLLPGLDRDANKILSQLHEDFGDDSVIVSVMSQYTPIPVSDYPELTEKVSKSSYLRVVEHAEKLGFRYLYTQDGESASESFIPEFR